MATLSGALTIVDIAKRTDPSGQAAVIGELLNQSNPIINDVPWVETNGFSGHEFTVRTSLPTASTVAANEGVAPTNSTTAQNAESTCIIRKVTEIAKDVAEFGGNTDANLMSESTADIEAMGQKFADLLITGNQSTDPTQFTGFYARYAATAGATGQNIILGGGSGSDNSSMLLVGWGKNKVYGIYPRGSKAGLEIDKRGLQTVDTTAGVGSAGGRMLAYQTFFSWKCGLCVQDWRYVVRVPNIDISNLVGESSAAALLKLMIKMTHRIPNLDSCSPVYYVNRTVFEMLDIQARNDVISGGQLKYEMVDGKRITSFRGIPVKLFDRIPENETLVS